MSKFILSLLFFGSFLLAAPEYPQIWWQPVVEGAIPDWEILPQSASKDRNEVILSKRNELGVLSNFAATTFTMLGVRYASIEGLWQSMKFPESESDERNRKQKDWPMKRSEVEALVAFEAMKAGKSAQKIMKEKGISYVSFRGYKIEYKGQDSEAYYDIIEAATRAKIDQNIEVKKIVLKTGDLILKPDHHEDKDGTKAWKYYDIYMKLRQELKRNPEKKLYSENWFDLFKSKYKLSKI